MNKRSAYIVNGITIYRIAAAPVLLLLLCKNQENWFKWLLALSFLTDLLDGYAARRYKVTSIAGARLDSIGDDLTVLVAIIGMLAFKWEFVIREKVIWLSLFGLFLLQLVLSLLKYGKQSSFHTYMAKVAALLQGLFLLSLFFLQKPVYVLFYAMAATTFLDLAEEICLVLILPGWQANVKGLFWVWQRRKPGQSKL